MMRSFVRAILGLLLAAPLLHAQQSVIRAHVIDANTALPVANAEVTIVDTDRSARTDSLGLALLVAVHDGKITLQARHVGFGLTTADITVTPRDTIDVALLLHPALQTLPKMTTIDSSDSHLNPEFEHRLRTHTGGYFVTESEIKKFQSSTIANLIRTKIPGVTPRVGAGDVTSLVSTRSAARCYVQTFLDGVRMLDTNIAIVNLESLGGIEYYPPGFAPVQYRVPPAVEPKSPFSREATRGPRAECGVLLLWTRKD